MEGIARAEIVARDYIQSACASAANYIRTLEKYIEDIDGKTVCIRCDGDTFIDDGIVVASDVVRR